MRGGALTKFIEVHAVATGFGASVVAHAVLVAVLASTRGNAESARDFAWQKPAATSRDDVTSIALALELPEVHQALETKTAEVTDPEVEKIAVESIETAPVETSATEATPQLAPTQRDLAQVFATVTDALRPSRDALRATTSEVFRGINAYLTRATAAMRIRTASPAQRAPVATHASTPVVDEPASMRQSSDATHKLSPTSTASHSSSDTTATTSTTGAVARATVIELAEPEYPRRSVRLGHEGTARVEVRVAPDGAIQGVTLVSSSGFTALDEAALAAARRGRYAPATRGDHAEDSIAVESFIVLPFEFRIKQR